MSKIVFDDGKEVTLSKETVARLRKELVPVAPDANQLKIDRFRAIKDGSGVSIALMAIFDDVWDGKVDRSNAVETHFLLRGEVIRLITGLSDMIGR